LVKLTIEEKSGSFTATYYWRTRKTETFAVSFSGKVYQDGANENVFYIIPEEKWKDEPEYYTLTLSGTSTLEIHNTFANGAQRDLLINKMNKER